MPTRNAESRFAQNPTNIDISRSKFNRNSSVKTSFNAGLLIPFYYDDVLPGDTFKIRASKVVRMSTLITPLMDNLWLDTYWFFVPNRLVWDHWKEFMGENTQSAWLPATEYTIPLTRSPSLSNQGWYVGSIADYLGIPTGVPYLYVSSLPLRAYALIWNEYFRDENLSDPINIYFGDNDVTAAYASDSFNYINDGYKGLDMLKVAKYRDLFTTALPAPQKGPAVSIALAGIADVLTGPVRNTNLGTYGLVFNTDQTISAARPIVDLSVARYSSTNGYVVGYQNQELDVANPDYSFMTPSNLYADLSSAPSVSINQLRLAFATQRLLERDARYGTRFTELIMGHYGITNPDARLQRPELIGASHNVLNIDQVVETSGTTDAYVLGETGGYSVTTGSDDEVSGYTCLEPGVVIGLACCRYEHSYQQGLEKMWSRENRLDFYWPELSNIGEVGIKNKEIYCQNPGAGETIADTDREDIFGYQEAWYDYRNKKNYVTGEMRSDYSKSLDAWHLADDYDDTPTLGHAWILEDGNTVNRVLAVKDNKADQVLADFYFEYDYVAPIPMYSVPGLIDMR